MDIFLGLDLCRKNVQMSYFEEDQDEPTSIYQLNNTETYQLPNVMFYSKDEKKWYVGNQVSTVRFQQDGQIVEDIVANVGSDKHVTVEGGVYTYDALLLILLKTHIEEFLSRSEDYVLRRLTVTLEEYTPKVYQVLGKLRKEFGLALCI